MKPRILRHRLEKICKLLVVIQKYYPDVNCVLHEDKGDHGQIAIELTSEEAAHPNMAALGGDLQTKGYQFTRKERTWLGQVSYTGRDPHKPTVVLTRPIAQDRLAIEDAEPETAHSF